MIDVGHSDLFEGVEESVADGGDGADEALADQVGHFGGSFREAFDGETRRGGSSTRQMRSSSGAPTNSGTSRAESTAGGSSTCTGDRGRRRCDSSDESSGRSLSQTG